MGANVLIALLCGYFALLAGLACRWLFLSPSRRGDETDLRSPTGKSELPESLDDLVRHILDEVPEKRPPMRCSFCDKSQHDVAKLISGPDVFICDECVTDSLRILRWTRPERWDDRPGPAALAGLLDRVVDGHQHAKRALATAVWRHVGRFKRPLVGGDDLRCDVLLAGGSSLVRRRLIRFLSDLSDVPLIVIDADDLVASGDRMEALKALCLAVYEPFEDDIELPPAILYVDNLDRLRGSLASGAIQRALLAILRGRCNTDWELWGAPIGDSRKLLLICGGDFAGLVENGQEFVTRDLERFGLCRPLADCLASIAILDSPD